MIRVVDKHGLHEVQKVTKSNGKMVAYQAGIPGDYGTIQRFPTLYAARAFVGIVPPNHNLLRK